MAFPTTALLDAFTYSGVGGLSAETLWPTPIAGISSGTLRYGDNAANTVNPSANTCSNYYNVSFGPDCEAYVTVVTLDTINTAFWVRLFIRLQNPTNSAIRNDYNVEISSAGTWTLAKTVAGTRTVLDTYTQAIAAGDKVGIQAVGTTISVWWWNHSNSTWTQVGTVTDSGVTGAGVLGLAAQGTTGDITYTLDNFSGGTYVASGGTKAITPTLVQATSTVTGAVAGKRRLTASGVSATSTAGGTITKLGAAPNVSTYGVGTYGVSVYGGSSVPHGISGIVSAHSTVAGALTRHIGTGGGGGPYSPPYSPPTPPPAPVPLFLGAFAIAVYNQLMIDQLHGVGIDG